MATNFDKVKRHRANNKEGAGVEQVKRKDMSDIDINELIDLRDLNGIDFSAGSKGNIADITYVKKSNKGLLGSIFVAILLVVLIVAGSWVFTGTIINVGSEKFSGPVPGIQLGNFMFTHGEVQNYANTVTAGQKYIISDGFYNDRVCDVNLVRNSIIYCNSGDELTSVSWQLKN